MKNAVKRRIVSASFQPYLWLTLSGFCFGANRDSDLLIFRLLQIFIGLFALVNPVGIIPVFISMTSYQTAAARNKTNLTANLSVAIILWISLFSATRFYNFLVYQLIRSVSPGYLVVTIAMSMISGKLGEDKQNKQEKSETAVRESIGVVPLALPLMAGPGDQFYHRLGYALSQH